jgi:predicted DCC family thiol-disulfide oxidoreductase YuxK
MVFDGDCGFCRFWIGRWQSISGDRLDYAPYQAVAARFPEISVDDFRSAVQLVLPSGEVFGGAHAVVRALGEVPGHGHWLAMSRRLPGFTFATDVAYRLIASHRGAALRVTRLLWATSPRSRRITARATSSCASSRSAISPRFSRSGCRSTA